MVTATIRQPSLFGDEPAKAQRTAGALRSPFPYFGGKSGVASLIWHAFGEVKQYIEPFCGSAAVLLAAPRKAPLEVVGDVNCYIANFWRCVKFQPDALSVEADYPVSHIDLAARHRWLVEPERVAALAAQLADPEWPGDARIAGWWCWGQCAWIGSGWCEPTAERERDGHRTARSRCSTPAAASNAKIPLVGNAGRGIQRGGQKPFVSSTGMGIQSNPRSLLRGAGHPSPPPARCSFDDGTDEDPANGRSGGESPIATVFL